MGSRIYVAAVTLLVAAASGCANDPMYLDSPMNLEAGMSDGMGGVTSATSSLHIPVKPESTQDARDRAALAMKLNMNVDDVPYIRVGDLDVEVEWTIKNLDNAPGQATIELNGANQFWTYDPSLIVLDPTNNEAPPTPGLQGDIPIDVPAMGEINGVFREDQLLEASIDLDQITRGHVNPFAAVLTVNKDIDSFQPLSAYVPPSTTMPMPPAQMPVGDPIPRAAFAQLLRVDLVFSPDRHMVLDYTVRVRAQRSNILHDMGLDAPADEIVLYDPAAYAP
jgi:hypothetical protein